MDIAQIRADIARLLQTVDKFKVTPTIPDNINGPTAVVYPEEFTYHATFDGSNDPRVVVQFVTPAVASASGQIDLDGWIGIQGEHSAVDAIEKDSRFKADQMRNYGSLQLQDGGSRYYSAEIVFDVLDDATDD